MLLKFSRQQATVHIYLYHMIKKYNNIKNRRTKKHGKSYLIVFIIKYSNDIQITNAKNTYRLYAYIG